MATESAGTLAIVIEANTAKFAKELKPRVEAIAAKVVASVKIGLDERGLLQNLRNKVREAQKAAEPIQVSVEAKTAGLREKVTAAVTAAGKGQEIDVPVEPDSKKLPAKTRKAKERVEKSIGPIKIKLDVAQSSKELLAGVTSLLKIPAVIAVIAPLIGLVSALSAGLVALGGALAPVVNLVGLAPAAFAAAAQGLGAFKLATAGVGDAIGSVADAEAKLASGQKLTQAELDKLKASLSGLSPAARTAVGAVAKILPTFNSLKRAVQQEFFAPFAKQITGLAKNLLPTLRTGLVQTAGILGRTTSGLATFFSSPAFKAQLGKIMASNNRSITALTAAVVPLVRAFLDLVQAGGPVIETIAKSAAATLKSVSAFISARAASGKLTKDFERGRVVAAQLLRIFRNLAVGLFGIGKAGAPLGRDLLTSIENLTKRFADFTKSVTGQNAIKKWFEDAKPAIVESARLIGAVVKVFGGLANSQATAPLLAQIRTQLLPAFQSLLTSVSGGFGPALVELATQVVTLFATLTGSGGGSLTIFVTTLSSIVEVVNRLLTTVPGATMALGVFLAAAAGAKALSSIAGIIGGAGKAIFDVGKSAVGAVTGTVQFVKALGGAELAAGKTATTAQKVGAAIRSGLGTALSVTGRGIRGTIDGITRLADASGGVGTRALKALGTGAKNAAAATGKGLATALSTSVGKVRQLGSAVLSGATAFGRLGKSIALTSAAAIKNVAVTAVTRTGQLAAASAAKVWAAAQFILNAVMSANPLVRIALVIGILVTAIVLAYQRSETFRKVVQAVWAAIKTAVTVSVIAVKNAVMSAFNAIRSFIGAVMTGIRVVIGVAWSIIQGIFNVYFTIYKTIVLTAFNVIKFIITSVMNGIKAVINIVWNAIKLVFQFYFTVYKTIVLTAFNAIRLGIQVALNTIKSIISTAWNAIKVVTSTLWNGIKTAIRLAIDGIVGFITGIKDRVSKTWTTTFDALKSAADKIWKGIKKVFGTPVEFVVNTVIGGVIRAVNKVLGWIKLPQIPEPHVTFAYAQGGRVPGYGGGDIVRAMVEPGEAIVPKHLVPEMAPWAALRGIPGFEGGGVVGAVGRGIGRGAKAVGHGVAAAGRGLADASEWVVDQSAHLLRKGTAAALEETIKPLVDQLAGAADRFGPVGEMVGGLGRRAVQGMVDYVRGRETETVVPNAPAGISANAETVRTVFATIYGWAGAQWDAAFRLLMGESGFNNTAQNPTSSAYGMFQFLDATWGAQGGSKTSDPRQQAILGGRYIKAAYGSPIAALAAWLARSPHWYAQGAWKIPRDQLAGLHKGEMVLPASFAEAVRAGVSAPQRTVGATVAAPRVTNITLNAVPTIPTERQLLRALSYAEVMER